MANNITVESTAKPCCYCCLRETSLIERRFGGLIYYVCPDCQSAGFFEGEPYKGKRVMTFVCDYHGDRHLDYLPRFFDGLAIVNEKNGTRKLGPKVKLGVDWKMEVENLRKEYLK
jgi:hypothetical protein